MFLNQATGLANREDRQTLGMVTPAWDKRLKRLKAMCPALLR